MSNTGLGIPRVTGSGYIQIDIRARSFTHTPRVRPVRFSDIESGLVTLRVKN